MKNIKVECQEQWRYTANHPEFAVTDKKYVVAEAKRQQIKPKAAAAAQTDLQRLSDPLELETNQYPFHALPNQTPLMPVQLLFDMVLEV